MSQNYLMPQLTSEFLSIVVCPSCHWRFAVDYEHAELVCTNPHCGLAYPTRNGIPVLLVDEARRPDRKV
jgi:uncharacterized protein YbaR (Trm112 family)